VLIRIPRVSSSYRWLALVGACLTALVGNPLRADTLTGVVFLDRNGNGIQDSGERGLAGVAVSDQSAVALTDANGVFHLEHDAGGTGLLFVSVPSGLRSVGSFWTKAADRTSFALASAPNQDAFTFVHASDLHISPDSLERTQRMRRMADDVKPAFVIITGDLVKDSLRVSEAEARSYYDLFAAERREFKSPVFTVPGNHEAFGIETKLSHVDPKHPLLGRAMYREYFGPDYYSFTYGGVHFVGLNTVDINGEWYYGHVDDRQLAWLQQDIAAIPADMPVVTFDHIPFYTTMDQIAGFNESATAAATLITVDGKTQFRHSVANATAVLAVLGQHRPVLALGGHFHVAERIERPGENVRYATAAAIVGPTRSFPSGFTVYTVRHGEIDGGRFVPLD
jgi:predicted MPP superfamily phosphohydrolase